MQKITSAYANKMLRSLEEDKAFWVNKEAASNTYVAAVNEEPVIPEYDYMTIANTIDEIDRKIVTIKHTLNLTNATAKVQVGNQEMSIDSILIRMAQLNKRKAVLDDMRKRLPKMRVYSNSFSSSGSVPEYKYIIMLVSNHLYPAHDNRIQVEEGDRPQPRRAYLDECAYRDKPVQNP